MHTYYVSLVYDLLGCYLEYQAESEGALREYLAERYLVGKDPGDMFSGTWKLPWCAVYLEIPAIDKGTAVVIKAKCSPIKE